MNTITIIESRGRWVLRFGGPMAQGVVDATGGCEIDSGYMVCGYITPGHIAEQIAKQYPRVCIAGGSARPRAISSYAWPEYLGIDYAGVAA